MDLEALMQRPVITIAADTPIRHARAVMVRHGIRHLPVVEAGALVGVHTDRCVRRVEPTAVQHFVGNDRLSQSRSLLGQRPLNATLGDEPHDHNQPVQRTGKPRMHKRQWHRHGIAH